MNEPPLLSMVIPWHNFPSPEELVARIVKRARESGLQVLVVDDASRWGTPCEVETLISREGADYQRLEVCVGPGEARNAGLKKVRSEFVTFTDADDAPGFEALRNMAQLGQEADADVVIGSYRHVSPIGLSTLHTPGDSFESALSDQPALWRYVFRRDFLERNEVHFSSGCYAEDLVFLLKVLSRSPRVITHSEVCYEYMAASSAMQLTSRHVRKEDFIAATQEIQSVVSLVTSRRVEQVCNAWLARIWLRRLRSSRGMQAKLATARQFPRRHRLVTDATQVAYVHLRRRLPMKMDTSQ
jgi:glycosyltransferase involved in cell wall biosynthesis